VHRRGHTRTTRSTLATIAVVALTLGGTLAFVGPAQADRVTKEDVEAAFHQAEVANEQVNQLDEDVKGIRAEIADLDGEIRDQLAVYTRQRDALGASVVQQQLDSPLGPTASLFGSEDPQEFLEGLGAVQALNSTRADAVEAFAATAKELRNRRTLLKDRTAELERNREKAEARRTKVQAAYEKAKAELARLTAAEQASLNASTTDIGFDVDASGRAKAAIDFASAQLGKPYIYGGVGPKGYDCSGLVMKSFAAAGISLPRVVGPQYAASRPISMSELKPGDIVFYGDMSHDGIYIGNGKVIHAPRPGKNVEVTSVSYGFTKAGRVV
jgi:cell wall-associated NlpC family hydrolase